MIYSFYILVSGGPPRGCVQYPREELSPEYLPEAVQTDDCQRGLNWTSCGSSSATSIREKKNTANTGFDYRDWQAGLTV